MGQIVVAVLAGVVNGAPKTVCCKTLWCPGPIHRDPLPVLTS